jgi:hypothetical protein
MVRTMRVKGQLGLASRAGERGWWKASGVGEAGKHEGFEGQWEIMIQEMHQNNLITIVKSRWL